MFLRVPCGLCLRCGLGWMNSCHFWKTSTRPRIDLCCLLFQAKQRPGVRAPVPPGPGVAPAGTAQFWAGSRGGPAGRPPDLWAKCALGTQALDQRRAATALLAWFSVMALCMVSTLSSALPRLCKTRNTLPWVSCYLNYLEWTQFYVIVEILTYRINF